MEYIVLFIVVIAFVFKSIAQVDQQQAYIVERLGRFYKVLEPGLHFVVPFIDRIAYKHDLREVPLDVPSQICITKDNTQLKVDGILFFQVTDPKRASYGSSDYILAITQIAQTTLRSVIGKMELDKTFEERDDINRVVVASLDEAAQNWGVKVLRYEIKDLLPPQDILHAMQAQITAEREKRARIATSEGRMQEQINLATGSRESAIQESEGHRQAAINKAQGDAEALRLVAEANAEAITKIASAAQTQGGVDAINMKIAEQYILAFTELAKKNNSMIVPAHLGDVSGFIASAMSMVKHAQNAATTVSVASQSA